jgi:predicted RNA methylase
VEMMQYCNHPHDAQTNEAQNQAIAVVTPKRFCYSGTISLYSRIALVIAIHNMGYYDFFDTLFTEIGVFMTVGLEFFLKTKQEKKITKGNYRKRLEVKVARSKMQKKQLHDIYKEHADTSYGHAVAL